MQTLIAGSRSICDYQILLDLIKDLDWNITSVVCGMAPGADLLGQRYAIENDLPIHEMPADWKTYGRGAGMERNTQMAYVADAAIILWDGRSRGTLDMLTKIKAQGIEYRVKTVSECGRGG